MLVFARSLLTAGEIERATELLAPRIGALPRGRTRAAAHLILAETADSDAHEEHLARAIAESVDDPPLHATALAKKAVSLAVARVEQIAAAEALARRALAVSRSVGPAVDPTVLAALAWARIMRGRPIGPRGNLETAPAGVSLFEATERPAAVRRTFRGEFGQARVAFCHLSVRADERGEARSAAAFHVQQLELELRVGDTVAATRLLDEWDHWTVVHDAASFRHRLEAMLGATQGFPDRAERAAAAVFDVTASDPLHNWDHLEANRAIGIAALFERHHDRARTLLSEIWAHTVREGVDEPGAFPVAPDLVEALVASGEVDQARDVTDRLERLAVSQRHPWGRVTARRCQAMVQLGGAGYSDAAATALSGAAAAYESLGAGFDQARSLLYLGRVQRRFKRRGEARRSLEAAGALFDRLSSDGWASQTRYELARVSGRRAAAEGQLTPSERRVAELAASGLSNKEIAAQLFVSVYTVEGHLKHAYAKLGTRSRSQLAVALRGVQ
jgi:DNA-binding CsgD family transcriptional regulator